MHSRKRLQKALIELRGSAGWSMPLLFTYSKIRFAETKPTGDLQRLDKIEKNVGAAYAVIIWASSRETLV